MSDFNSDVPKRPEDELDPEMTVVIDDEDEDVPTIVVEPEVEEVLVVLPDEDDDLGDVPLLTHHPDEPEPVTEPVPSDVYQDFLDESEPTEVEALPEIEHVEDITALLQDESVQLEAPTDPHAVRYDSSAPRRRLPWKSLAAAACLAAAGVLYGPKLMERFGPGGDTGPIARSQPQSTPATGGTDGVVAAVEVDPELERVAFREWVTTALSHNLGAVSEVEIKPSAAGDGVEALTPDSETSGAVEETESAAPPSDQENK